MTFKGFGKSSDTSVLFFGGKNQKSITAVNDATISMQKH